jgi:hypothetical protein
MITERTLVPPISTLGFADHVPLNLHQNILYCVIPIAVIALLVHDWPPVALITCVALVSLKYEYINTMSPAIIDDGGVTTVVAAVLFPPSIGVDADPKNVGAFMPPDISRE